MKILFCGYFYSDEDDVLHGNVTNVFDKSIIDLFKEHELAIIGLHSPLVKRKDIYKTQRAMSNDVAMFLGKIPKTILVTLANERLLDCGEKGLINTLEQLDQNDLYHLGAGLKEESLMEPFIFDNVAIFNYVDDSATYDDDEDYGANVFSSDYSYEEVKKAKMEYKDVIVILKTGLSDINYPTPSMKKKAHALVDAGATLVLIESPSFAGGFETYNGSKIVYGHGDLMLDTKNDKTKLNNKDAFLISYDVKTKETVYYPIVLKEHKVFVDNSRVALDAFYSRSKKLLDDDFIKEEYEKFARRFLTRYLTILRGYSKVRRFISLNIFKGYFILRRYNINRLNSLSHLLNSLERMDALKKGLRLRQEEKEKY